MGRRADESEPLLEPLIGHPKMNEEGVVRAGLWSRDVEREVVVIAAGRKYSAVVVGRYLHAHPDAVRAFFQQNVEMIISRRISIYPECVGSNDPIPCDKRGARH